MWEISPLFGSGVPPIFKNKLCSTILCEEGEYSLQSGVDDKLLARAEERFKSGPSLEDLVYKCRTVQKEAAAAQKEEGKLDLFDDDEEESDEEEQTVFDANAPHGEVQHFIIEIIICIDQDFGVQKVLAP